MMYFAVLASCNKVEARVVACALTLDDLKKIIKDSYNIDSDSLELYRDSSSEDNEDNEENDIPCDFSEFTQDHVESRRLSVSECKKIYDKCPYTWGLCGCNGLLGFFSVSGSAIDFVSILEKVQIV